MTEGWNPSVSTLRKVLNLLTVRERRQAFVLLPLVIVMATAGVAGIVSIIPFLALIVGVAVTSELDAFR
ncbi:MAG: hypothetical protein LC667_08645 [Thioalkalivibrio sp.]|nr:hypothetical protein [Thioalkalivibrio sp.]